MSTLLLLLGSATAVSPPAVDERIRADIKSSIDEILEAPAFEEATVGLHVVRLSDGAQLFGRSSDEQLVPASNIKILTTAAALHYLTPDYRFKTEVYGEVDDKGIVRGDLIVKGYGDPWLVPERIWYLASRLYYQGVRAINGNIVIDDTFFDGPRDQNGWEQDGTTASYMAKAGAFAVSFNSVLVHILPAAEAGLPAKILLDPPQSYAKIDGTVTTSNRRRSWIDVDIEPARDRSVIKVNGRISVRSGGRAYWRRVDNPPIYGGEVVRAMLKQVGIRVKGRVVTGALPPDSKRLVTLSSPRMADLVDRINKHSNNFMAGQVARALGAERYGVPGSWEKGRRAIETFLADEVGIERGSYMLGNASGLHDVNRMSAKQVVAILDYMHRQPDLRPEFVASLAVAGGTGTLSQRMTENGAMSMLRAKTGTLSIASALSGYVTCQSGEMLAFSIIVNDYKESVHDVWEAQDEIGGLLAELDFGASTGETTVSTSGPSVVPVMP